MARHRSRTSQQCQSEFAESFACEFDAAAVHNTVWETVDEDADLARLCDAATAADEALAVRGDRAFAAKLDEAWGRLDTFVGTITGISRSAGDVIVAVEADADQYPDGSIYGGTHDCAPEWVTLL
mgnify:CR=1 FL=1